MRDSTAGSWRKGYFINMVYSFSTNPRSTLMMMSKGKGRTFLDNRPMGLRPRMYDTIEQFSPACLLNRLGNRALLRGHPAPSIQWWTPFCAHWDEGRRSLIRAYRGSPPHLEHSNNEVSSLSVAQNSLGANHNFIKLKTGHYIQTISCGHPDVLVLDLYKLRGQNTKNPNATIWIPNRGNAKTRQRVTLSIQFVT